MKYGYLYMVNEDEKKINEIFHSTVSRSCIFIDKEEAQPNFDLLLKAAKKTDQIYISSIQQVASNYKKLIENLLKLQKKSIQYLYRENMIIPISELISLYDYVEENRKVLQSEKQLAGIKVALEKKATGRGGYGRPLILMPENFEENILLILKKQKTHEYYRKQCGLKRATYYKMVRKVRDRWIENELNYYLPPKKSEQKKTKEMGFQESSSQIK